MARENKQEARGSERGKPTFEASKNSLLVSRTNQGFDVWLQDIHERAVQSAHPGQKTEHRS